MIKKIYIILIILLINVAFAETIKKIEFIGNKRINTDYLKTLISITPNSNYNEEVVNQNLRNIYASDFFTNVSASFNNGVLTFVLTESSVVGTIKIQGNKKIKADLLNKDLLTKERSNFSDSKINLDIKRIKEIYYRSGYLTAQVNYTATNNKDGSLDVVINIIEGKKTVINSVVFLGNKAFSSYALKKVILTKPSAWWRIINPGEVYDKSRILQDGELLRQFYLENGYPNFTVISTSTQLSGVSNQLQVTYNVDEGERYKFGNFSIDITVDSLLQYQDQLYNAIQIDSKEWFKASSVDVYASQLASTIKKLGFQFIGVDYQTSFNTVLQTVEIKFVVKPESRIFVNRIETAGNTKTRDYVIRRLLKFNENDELTSTKINAATRNLYRTQFFGNVDIQAQPSQEAGKQNVVVNVEERSTASISAGGGYSTGASKFNLNASVVDNNFLGTGNSFGINFEVASNNTSYGATFSNPYFLNKELVASVGVQRQYTSNFFGNNASRSKDILSDSLNLGLGHKITPDLSQSIGYEISRNTTKNSLLINDNGTTVQSVINHRMVLDKTNNGIYPTKGTLTEMNNEYSGVGGDIYYFKNTLKTIWYQKLYKDIVFSTLLYAGNVAKINNKEISNTYKFDIGDNTLRGFKLSSVDGIGPSLKGYYANSLYTLGGRNIFRGSFQIETPVPGVSNYSLLFHIFNDYGTVTDFKKLSKQYPQYKYIANDAVRSSAGFGLTWVSPLGILNLDFAWPIMKQPTDDTSLISFTIGARF